MTYEEFCERLEWYFSHRDIEELNCLGYAEAADAHEEQDITTERLRELGRDFVIDLLRDDCRTDMLENFMTDVQINLEIEMTESNAAALLADIESGAF